MYKQHGGHVWREQASSRPFLLPQKVRLAALLGFISFSLISSLRIRTPRWAPLALPRTKGELGWWPPTRSFNHTVQAFVRSFVRWWFYSFLCPNPQRPSSSQTGKNWCWHLRGERKLSLASPTTPVPPSLLLSSESKFQTRTPPFLLPESVWKRKKIYCTCKIYWNLYAKTDWIPGVSTHHNADGLWIWWTKMYMMNTKVIVRKQSLNYFT